MKTLRFLVLFLFTTSPLIADGFHFVDRYDWYKDSYIMGWKSKALDLVYNPKVNDFGNAFVRSDLHLSDDIGFRYELSRRGRDDFGPSLRIFHDGPWAAYFEPSWGRGEPGVLINTPYGPIGKLKIDTDKHRVLACEGIFRGGVTALALKGTKPPRGPLAGIAEHVVARSIRRLLLGAGSGLGFILAESLVKRLFRSFGGIFGVFFDGPNTPGLTPSRQTLSDEHLAELKRKGVQ